MVFVASLERCDHLVASFSGGAHGLTVEHTSVEILERREGSGGSDGSGNLGWVWGGEEHGSVNLESLHIGVSELTS